MIADADPDRDEEEGEKDRNEQAMVGIPKSLASCAEAICDGRTSIALPEGVCWEERIRAY